MEEKALSTTIDEEEFEIGRFGKAWGRFITENFPDFSAKLKKTDRWGGACLRRGARSS